MSKVVRPLTRVKILVCTICENKKKSSRCIPFTRSELTYGGQASMHGVRPKEWIKARTIGGGSLRLGSGSVDFCRSDKVELLLKRKPWERSYPTSRVFFILLPLCYQCPLFDRLKHKGLKQLPDQHRRGKKILVSRHWCM